MQSSSLHASSASHSILHARSVQQTSQTCGILRHSPQCTTGLYSSSRGWAGRHCSGCSSSLLLSHPSFMQSGRLRSRTAKSYLIGTRRLVWHTRRSKREPPGGRPQAHGDMDALRLQCCTHLRSSWQTRSSRFDTNRIGLLIYSSSSVFSRNNEIIIQRLIRVSG